MGPQGAPSNTQAQQGPNHQGGNRWKWLLTRLRKPSSSSSNSSTMSTNTFGRGPVRMPGSGATMGPATRGLTKNEIIHLGPTYTTGGQVLNATHRDQLSPNLSYNRTAECFQSRLAQGSMPGRDFIHQSNNDGSNMANGHIHNHPFNSYGFQNQHHQASLFNGASSNEYTVHQGHQPFPAPHGARDALLPDPQQLQWPFEDSISARRPSQWSLTQDQDAQTSMQLQVSMRK